jgi:hypothetical protein
VTIPSGAQNNNRTTLQHATLPSALAMHTATPLHTITHIHTYTRTFRPAPPPSPPHTTFTQYIANHPHHITHRQVGAVDAAAAGPCLARLVLLFELPLLLLQPAGMDMPPQAA